MAKIKSLKEADLYAESVIIRVDFNCPVKNNAVEDTFRIDRTLDTIKYLLEKQAKRIVILTHLGRPDGEFKAELSLKPVVQSFVKKISGPEIKAEEIELIDYAPDIKESLTKIKSSNKKIIFLENIRFWPEEEKGEADFAAELAGVGEIFVNDAFSACHRDHASVTGIAKILPSYAGLLLEEELNKITEVIESPAQPAIAVVGGAKLETKLPVLKILAEKYDKVLVGGLIAVEIESDIDKTEKYIGSGNKEKIILPLGYTDEKKRDIDQETAQKFAEIIKTAKTILWNGPMGMFEKPPFDEGSRIVGNAIAKADAYKLTGGGETNELLALFNIFDKIDFVSTGGGAMLEFIAGEKLPGVEALKH